MVLRLFVKVMDIMNDVSFASALYRYGVCFASAFVCNAPNRGEIPFFQRKKDSYIKKKNKSLELKLWNSNSETFNEILAIEDVARSTKPVVVVFVMSLHIYWKEALAIRRIFSLVDMITKAKFLKSPNDFEIRLFG